MPVYSAGEARAIFSLDTSAFDASIARVKKQYAELAAAAAAQGKVRLPGVASATGTNQAAIAQARLATEQQRTALTANNAAKAAQQLATEEQRTASAAANATKSQLALAAAQQRAAGKGTGGGLGPALPRTLDGLSGAAATALKGFLGLQAVTQGFSFARMGAQLGDTRTSFDNLAKSAGTTGDAILVSLRDAANGTIRDSALIQSANTGILLTQGKLTKDLPQLVQIARASAKATGQEVGFVFDSLVKGIARGSPMIIDNAGITINAAQAFDVYAKSIGKTSDQLTKSEQQQATLNAVVKNGADIIRQVGLDGNSAAANIDRAVVSVQNLGEALATKIAPFVGNVAGGLANLLNTGSTTPEAGTTKEDIQSKLVNQATSYEAYGAAVVATNTQIKTALASDPVLAQLNQLSALTPAEFAYTQALIASGVARGAAIAQTRAQAGTLAALSDEISIASAGDAALTAQLFAQIPALAAVATGTDAERTAVLDLIDARGQGTISDQEFAAALAALTQAHDLARQAAQEEGRETRRLAQTFLDVIPAANAAAAAVAAVTGAKLRDRALGQDFGNVSTAETGLGGGAAGKSNVFQRNDDLRNSEFQLQLARSTTSAQRIAILRQELAITNDQIGKNRILAQIAQEQNSAARGTRADPNAKGLGALDTDAVKLAGDLQSQLAEVNAQLARGNLTQHQRNQLLVEQRDLEEKISSEKNKQLHAALDAAEQAIRNRQEARKDASELEKANRILQSGRASGAFKAAAADAIALIGVQQQQRALDLSDKIRASGGVVPTPIGAVPAGAAGPVPTGAPSPATGGGAAAGGTPIIFQVGSVEVARVIVPFVVDAFRAGQTQANNAGVR